MMHSLIFGTSQVVTIILNNPQLFHMSQQYILVVNFHYRIVKLQQKFCTAPLRKRPLCILQRTDKTTRRYVSHVYIMTFVLTLVKVLSDNLPLCPTCFLKSTKMDQINSEFLFLTYALSSPIKYTRLDK